MKLSFPTVFHFLWLLVPRLANEIGEKLKGTGQNQFFRLCYQRCMQTALSEVVLKKGKGRFTEKSLNWMWLALKVDFYWSLQQLFHRKGRFTESISLLNLVYHFYVLELLVEDNNSTIWRNSAKRPNHHQRLFQPRPQVLRTITFSHSDGDSVGSVFYHLLTSSLVAGRGGRTSRRAASERFQRSDKRSPWWEMGKPWRFFALPYGSFE